MGMFDEMFKEKEVKEKKEVKKKFTQKKINLFKETPNKKEIDVESMNVVNDIVLFMYDNKELPDEIKEKFKKILSKIKNNYNIRIMCINSNAILPLIKETYESKKVNLIKPWDKFCKVDDYRVWLPSNINIEYAANYVKNFDKLPTGIKYIKSAYLTLLTSFTGKHLAKAVLVYDPYYDKKNKLDYKKSKDTYEMYNLVNALDIVPIYNINLNDELESFLSLVSK